MLDVYSKLTAVILFPVVVSMIFYILDTKTSFGKLNYWVKQVIYGIVFGAIAIFGTEFGIPVEGAQINCRDAAVLCGGLFFGGPAGIIAGLIGGIERWIAVAWGIGSFTRVACSVSTALAGIIAALLRKFLFENKYPNWIMGLASGLVVETFHLTMVFLTNLDQVNQALVVIKACLGPMIIGNGVSVMLGSFAMTLLSKERVSVFKRDSVKITDTFQKWLFIIIIVAFVVSSAFVVKLQDVSSSNQTEKLLTLAAEDVEQDVNDAVERALRDSIRQVASELESSSLTEISQRYDIPEISIINKYGIITQSTNKDFVKYDMASGEQSAEFLCLLTGTSFYTQDYGPISYDNSISRKYVGLALDEGFLQIGYDATTFQNLVYSKVFDASSNKHVGENGFVLIYDQARVLVSGPNFFDTQRLGYGYALGTLKPEELPPEKTVFELELMGKPYYARYYNSEGYTIASFMDVNEAENTKMAATYANNFMEVLMFAILFIVVYNLIKYVVINQLKQVTGSLRKIAAGDLTEVVKVRTNEEFAALSDDINATVDTLKRYIDEAAARIDADLAMAKDIQASALPSVFPAFPKRKDFDIYARMDTAKEVGGDFYDFYMTKDNLIHLLIADVSGKGIPAAMFMMRAKTQLQSLTKAELPINEVFTRGNSALCEGNDAGMFVTAWQGGIDLDTGLVEFANGGHNPPLLKRADGKFEYVKKKVNLVLAGMDGMPYAKQEFRLYPGDILYLYTDGITEATDANNELYGEDRLLDALNSKEFADMKELCDFIKEDVDRFVGDAPQFDDMTMLAFKFNGQQFDGNVILEEKKKIAIPAKVEYLDDLMNFVDANLEIMDCPMKVQTQIDVAVDEIFANIASYAYQGGEGDFYVEMYPCRENIGVVLKFIDKGMPYNPLEHEDPDITLTAEERGIGGLGILIIKKTMTNVEYEYVDGKNILTITKHFA